MIGENDATLNKECLGKTFKQWEEEWKPLAGGLKKPHPEIKSVGLVRAKLAEKIMYVFRATEFRSGGIGKGIQRIIGPEQTGNKGYGPRMLRENLGDLDVEILIVGDDFAAAEAAKELKKLAIKVYDPEWNRAHTRRMKALRAGTLKTS